MKVIAVLATISALVIALSCSDDPTAPGGSLPTVQNLVVVEDSCGGMRVFLSWDAVADTVDIDGYEVWYATTDPGTWGITYYVDYPDTSGHHSPSQTGHYTVRALKGTNHSTDYSNEVNTLATRNYDTHQLRTDGNSGAIISETAITTGDATSPNFAQDIYVAESNSLLYVYAGNHDPATYPGGASTMLALNTGTDFAPEPGTADWVDSIQVDGQEFIYVMLESGYYTEFYVADTTYTNGFDIGSWEYQPIHSLRLFNVVW